MWNYNRAIPDVMRRLCFQQLTFLMRAAALRSTSTGAAFATTSSFLLLASLDALRRCLGFGLFHGFFGLSNALGAGFGAFFALLVEHFLAAQQLDERLFGAVALLPCGAYDAQ